MKLTIFTTMTEPTKRQDAWKEAIHSYLDLADEVLILVGDKDLWGSQTAKEILKEFKGESRIKVSFCPWPKEFDWRFIGQQFQKGYELAEGDWVIRADLDYIFHEKDRDQIRFMLTLHDEAPAVSFWKYQFLLVDRYQIKSRPVIGINKKVFGDRIRLEGGGDLCQPMLDGEELSSDKVPEIKSPVWNYDFCFKDRATIMKDFPRFSRAWISTFQEPRLGGPDDESAFAYFKEMMIGRFTSRGHERVNIKNHPKYVQKRILNMTPDMFGYSLFGWVGETAEYFVK